MATASRGSSPQQLFTTYSWASCGWSRYPCNIQGREHEIVSRFLTFPSSSCMLSCLLACLLDVLLVCVMPLATGLPSDGDQPPHHRAGRRAMAILQRRRCQVHGPDRCATLPRGVRMTPSNPRGSVHQGCQGTGQAYHPRALGRGIGAVFRVYPPGKAAVRRYCPQGT